MKQTILNIDKNIFVKRLNFYKFICVTLIFAMISLNVLFCILRNADNHMAMLILNIAVDIIIGWSVVVILSFWVIPQSKIIKLFESKKGKIKGKVISVSDDAVRVREMDCKKVEIECDDRRMIFLPENTISLIQGREYVIGIVSNIIVEVEYE